MKDRHSNFIYKMYKFTIGMQTWFYISVLNIAEWSGEVPACFHRACNVGSNPTSAIPRS